MSAAPAPTPEPLRSPFCLLCFLVCASNLGPYLFGTLVVERPMFSRLYVAPQVLLFVLVVVYWYLGARGFLGPRRYRGVKIGALVLMVVGLGLVGLLSAAGILLGYVVCEAVARRTEGRLPASWWSLSRAVPVAVATVALLFPAMNYVYTFGNYRSFSPPIFRENPLFGVNADGLRGPRVGARPSPPVPRLLFLGDSSTFGFPYPFEAAYPFQVGRLLEARGAGGVEVVNAGIPGQSLSHIEARLDEFLAYEPDVVFLMVGVHYDRSLRHSEDIEGFDPARVGSGFASRFWPPASVILLTGWVWQAGFIGYWGEEPEIFQNYQRSLASLVARVADSGAELVLLEYPSPKIRKWVQKHLRETAEREGLPWLPLSQLAHGKQDYAVQDEVHPDRELHGRMAEAIAELLVTDARLEERIAR